jgi:hypothetical protein
VSEEFLINFMKCCVLKGLTTPEEISTKANLEIFKINKDISKLREKRVSLETLTIDSGKTKKNTTILNQFVTESDLTDSNKEICKQLCNFIGNNPGLSLRDVVDCMCNIGDEVLIYTTILWLLKNNYLSRGDGSINLVKEWK